MKYYAYYTLRGVDKGHIYGDRITPLLKEIMKTAKEIRPKGVPIQWTICKVGYDEIPVIIKRGGFKGNGRKVNLEESIGNQDIIL